MISYLVELTVSWSLLLAAYFLFLRRETFFRFSRWYLLLGLVLGLLIPLVDWSSLFTHSPDSLGALYITPVQYKVILIDQQVAADPNLFTWATLFYSVYIIGILFTGFRFVKGLKDIRSLRRNAKLVNYGDYHLALTQKPHLPFSFLKTVYWTEDFYSETDGKDKILTHEIKHISALHSLDVLFVELLCILFWFHPLVHIYRKELRQVHEYEADAAACILGNKKAYGQLLVAQAQSGFQLALANHFFYSQLKNRLKMITKKPSHRKAALKYLLTFPLIGVLALLFSFSKNNFQSGLMNNKLLTTDNQAAPSAFIPLNGEEDLNTGAIPVNMENRSETERKASIKEEKSIREAQDSIPKNILVVIDGEVQPKRIGVKILNELDSSSIQSINILKDKLALNKYGDLGKNGVIELITLKPGNPPALFLESVEKATPPDTAIQIQLSDTQNQDPGKLLLIVDGDIMNLQTKTSTLKGVDPNNIESVNVLKGESALQKYGAKEVDGVIEIKTKNPDEAGKKSETDKAQKDPSEKITVIGYKSQTSGEPVKIEVKTKTENSPLQEIIVIGHRSENYKSENQPESRVLIIMDDQKIGHGNQGSILKQIDPKSIKAISVLKGEAAIDKYGSEGAGGVIVIKTKIPNQISDQSMMELREFRLFPNPAQHELTVEFEGHSGEYQLSILDIRGVNQVSKTISNTQFTRTNLDLSGLNAGIYYLIIQSEGKVLSRPFVKE